MDKILLRKVTHCLVIMVMVCFMTPNLSYGQCAGKGAIVTGGPLGNPALLDPDGDGDIVGDNTVSSFSSTSNNLAELEPLISGLDCDCEVPWRPVGGVVADPDNDLNGAGSCDKTDIVSDGSDPLGGPFDHAYYTIFDGDGNCNTSDLYIAFRIRVGMAASGSGAFSFEILASTDGLVGTADPQGIQCCGSGKAANIGFEREVQLQTGGGGNGVNVYDIDGIIDLGGNPTPNFTHTLAANSQLATTCGTDVACAANPTFYSFFIPLSELGITNCLAQLDDLTFVAVTTQSGNPAIAKCTSTSDIGGVDGNANNSACGQGPYSGDCVNNAAIIDQLLCAAGAFNSLPVELINFSAKLEASKVNLDWSTASEQNNLGFDVERSRDGRNWDVLDFVPGRGTTNERVHYSYEDKNPLIGYNYYRLKQLDYNGVFRYSKIVSVLYEQDKGELLSIFPNPNEGVFKISLKNENRQKAYIKLFDSTGSLIWSEQFNENNVDIYWEKEFHLPQREVYFVVTQVGSEIETRKVVVIDKK